MTESRDLQQARHHLNKVNLLSKDTKYLIDEGFFLLEEIADGNTPESTTARNLGRTYMHRFHAAIREKLAEEFIPEPDLELLLRAAGALEANEFAMEVEIEPLRMEIASRLIDSYFQGYTDTERSDAIEKLMDRIDKQRER